MDGPRECHTEWNTSDREGKILYGIPHMWNLKRTQLQKRKTLTDFENELKG